MHNSSLSHSSLHFDSRAIHSGQAPDPSTGAIMTPIFQTSTFVQSSPGVHSGFEYSRTQNPTRHALEDCIASLELAQHGVAFSSGSAATASLLHTLPPNSHIIASDDLYGGSYRLFTKVLAQRNLHFSFVDMTNSQLVQDAIQPNTKLLWAESPTNPTLKLYDISSLASIAHQHDALLAVDNTFMSPFFQNPISLGADIVVHSTTKFINGHSDVVGGIVVTNLDNIHQQLRFVQNSIGATPSPFDAWLILRGLKTLHVRMRQHQHNALIIAQFLEQHPAVQRVLYPGLPSHPQHHLALSQMSGFGAMITFYLHNGLDAAKHLLENVRLFSLAESLGGVESLIEHPAIMTHASVPPLQRQQLGIHDNLVRLSVGIEHHQDLIDDLQQALPH